MSDKPKDLFSKAYKVIGDGIAVLRTDKIRDIPEFQKSVEKMRELNPNPTGVTE